MVDPRYSLRAFPSGKSRMRPVPLPERGHAARLSGTAVQSRERCGKIPPDSGGVGAVNRL